MLSIPADFTIGHRGLAAPSALDQLPVLVSSAGQEDRCRDYVWHGRRRGDGAMGLLQYTVAGCGRLDYEGRSFDVPAGHLMMVHWPHDHCYRLPEEGRWVFRFVIIKGGPALRMLRTAIAQLGPVVDCRTDSAGADHLEALVGWALAEGNPDPIAASRSAYDLLCLLLARGRSAAARSAGADAIDRACTHARSRLHLPLTVADMARIAGLSPAHFSRVFHRAVGDTPLAWLNAQRLERAQELLADQRLDLDAIAQRCGFANGNYFGKVFRRTYGISPGMFRRGT